MTGCELVVHTLAAGAALDDAQRSHVDGCEECRMLVAADRALGVSVGGSAPGDTALPPALREALRLDTRRVGAFTPWRRALPALLAPVVFAATVWAVVPRADLAHQPAGRVALGLVAALAGLAASLAALLHGGRHGLGLPARARWAFTAVAFAGFALVTAAVTVPVEGSVHLDGAAAAMAAVGCALHGSLVAAAAAVAVFWGARRSAAVDPVAAGLVAGLGAGFVGALAQHLQCPVMDLDHTLVAHVAPLAVGAAAGAIVGRRWLAP